MKSLADSSKCWITTREASELTGYSMDTIQRNCKSDIYKIRICKAKVRGGNSGKAFEIDISSLPTYAQEKYFAARPTPHTDTPVETAIVHDPNDEATRWASMTGWQKEHALAWVNILKETKGMSTNQLDEYRKIYKTQNAGFKISRSSIYTYRTAYKSQGIAGLSPNWGQTRGSSRIPTAAFERFVQLFFTEKGPGVKSCHYEVFGFMKRANPVLKWSEFPSPAAFYRLLKSSYSQGEIDFRRRGKSFWMRRHEKFIKRDWSALAPNELLIADDHLLDLMVIGSDGKVIRPWLNLFICARTLRAQGWMLTEESPCADTVYHSFALTCIEHGIPAGIMLDNGKNYKAFSQINKHKKWDEQEQRRARSLLGVLKVNVSFTREYSGQSKSIEPRFRILIENFCKKLPGYCGFSSASKPEVLKATLKAGNLLTFRQCEEQIGIFFRDFYNNLRSDGRTLKGLSPNQLYDSLPKTINKVTVQGASFLFMRTSKDMTIRREGIVDNSLGIELTYWHEMFHGLTGHKVYIRRDLKEYNVAWVYNAENDSFLCKAEVANSIPGHANTPIEKQALVAAIRAKHESLKRVRESTRTKPILNTMEILENSIAGVRAESGNTETTIAKNREIQILLTPHDKAVQEHEKQQKTGTYDLAAIAPPPRPTKTPLFLFETDKGEYERQQAAG
jgi:hypothetical protein